MAKKNKHIVRKMAKGFNRLAIIAGAIILQLVFYMMVFTSLYKTYIAFQIVSTVFFVISLIHLQSRDMIAEMKYSWAIVILMFPSFGWLVYMGMSENHMLITRRKLLKRINEHSEKYYGKSGKTPFSTERSEKETGEYKRDYTDGVRFEDMTSCMRYVAAASAAPPYVNNRMEYYPTGEEFFESLKRELKLAKKFIFMEYFIISEGEMFDEILSILEEKVKEGVEVRVMYDDIGSLGCVSAKYYKKISGLGIKAHCFNMFVPIVSAVQNNRDHRKITVVDGITGFIGGSNIADEYINAVERYGVWKDSTIMIKGGAVKSLTLMFLQLWALQDKKVEDFSPFLNIEYPVYGDEGIIQPFGDGPKPIYEDAIAENVYVNMIERANKRLWIMTPYFVTDKRITDAIRIACRRGVDVRIIIPGIPDKKSVYLITRRTCNMLLLAGAKIYRYTPGFIHSKNVYADDDTAICGTINFDYRSLYHHYECAVIMKNCSGVDVMREDFEKTFGECELLDEKSAKLNAFERLISDIAVILSPML